MHSLLLLSLLLSFVTPPATKPRREFKYGDLTAGRGTFNYDGRLVLVSGKNARVAVFHGRTAMLVREFRGHRHLIGDIASWPGRDTVVSGDATGLLLFWKSKTARQIAQAQVPGEVLAVRPQPGGSLVAVLTKQGVWLVDMKSGSRQSLATALAGRVPTVLSFNQAGTHLAIGFANGDLTVRDVKSQRQEQVSLFKTPVCALSFGSDTLLAVAGTPVLGIWRPSVPGSAQFQTISGTLRAVAQQPAGGVVLGLASGNVIRYDPGTRQEEIVGLTKAPIRGLVVHPHEPLVLATYALEIPQTWLLTTPTEPGQ